MIKSSHFPNVRTLPTCLLMLFVVATTSLRADDLPVADDAIHAEMFAAMDAGQIDVKFIPINATKANVLVKNLTDKPMNLKLPAAFAGVPVLAQFGGGMGGMGGGGMGGMGGFQRIAPERVKKISVVTVCLEHGKPDPNPKMAYKIIPIEQFTDSPNVRLVCEALGNGLITQNTAQAAAWHLMDKMSWPELAQKNRVESKYTGNLRWFSPLELKTAMLVVQEIDRIVSTNDEYAKQSDADASLADDPS